MNIVNKNVNDLIPYINNPRLNDNAVDAVASSIKNFGFKVPIVIDSGNEIVTGHTRLKAAKKLGLQEVPCIIADDLTPEQIKAFRLADNKVAEFADWDFNLLNLELEELDFDMEEFGFDELINDTFGDDFSLDNNTQPIMKTMTFTLSNAQFELVDEALKTIELEECDTIDNENANGNKLYKMVMEWVEARKN